MYMNMRRHRHVVPAHAEALSMRVALSPRVAISFSRKHHLL